VAAFQWHRKRGLPHGEGEQGLTQWLSETEGANRPYIKAVREESLARRKRVRPYREAGWLEVRARVPRGPLVRGGVCVSRPAVFLPPFAPGSLSP
jgi:hypothetical protein